MAKVQLTKVTKSYGNVQVVNPCSLTIEDKEFVVFVGPSGCGKSTSLRMIAGLEEISSGEIFIGEKKVNNLPPKDRNIAMVFQNYALYPHMDVYNNMAFSLKLQKFSNDEIKKRVEKAAEILELTPLLKRKPSQLSGGQRQRVAMGRAIVRNPQVFLFDEPLSNLDAKLRTQMRIEIKKLHQQMKTTTIYVTHDQVEAMTLADKIVVMNKGNIEQIGTPLEIYNHPANTFVANFMGNPPMNLIDGEIVTIAGKTNLDFADHKIPCSSTQSKLSVGIRPEHISLVKGKSSKELEVTTKILIKEALGAETLLHVQLGVQDFIIKVDGMVEIEEGAIVKVYIDLNQIHLFDRLTKMIIKKGVS